MKTKNILLTALLISAACSHHNSNLDKKQGFSVIQPNLLQDSILSFKKEETSLEAEEAEVNQLSKYREDSLTVFFKKQYEIEYFKIENDTLELVMGSDITYYPFGHCYDVHCMKKRLRNFIFLTERDATDRTIKLYRGSYKNSFIKIMHDSENKQIQIVSGEINDFETVLFNNIKIGMTEESFINLFIKNNSFIKKNNPKVIKITSVLDGINHFYTFKNSVLKSIFFDTNYVLNKD